MVCQEPSRDKQGLKSNVFNTILPYLDRILTMVIFKYELKKGVGTDKKILRTKVPEGLKLNIKKP